MNLEVKPSVTRVLLLLEPAFKLFGSVSSSIIKDQDHGMHVTTQCLEDDLLSHKGLEVTQAFARPPCPVNLPIGDRGSNKQMSCAATMVTRFMQHRLSRLKRARRLLALAGLNGDFLIETEQPDALAQKGLSLTIGMQDRASALQEGDRIMNMRPAMIAKGGEDVRPSTSDPRYWPRCEQEQGLGSRVEPIQPGRSPESGTCSCLDKLHAMAVTCTRT